MIELLCHHFQEGGWAMWLILVWLLASLGVATEKALFLFAAQQQSDVLVASILRCLDAKNLRLALDVARSAKSPMGGIIHAGLCQVFKGPNFVQRAMDEKALRLLPQLSKGIPYLALFANLAMLSGLLGTILGLIQAFGAVGGEAVAHADKARLLADGISEAMNCTAFGLFSAITALAAYSLLNGWCQVLEDDIHLATVKVHNEIKTFEVGKLGELPL